ncbi:MULTISPECIES: hypothetical protein [unclassified Helicobacter]|nr:MULTISPECIES: hypothetical protein [unclassified Helicobacter]
MAKAFGLRLAIFARADFAFYISAFYILSLACIIVLSNKTSYNARI